MRDMLLCVILKQERPHPCTRLHALFSGIKHALNIRTCSRLNIRTCSRIQQALELLCFKAANVATAMADDATSWLSLLAMLPCFPWVCTGLAETLRRALAVETDAVLVGHYLEHLRLSVKVRVLLSERVPF
jgi:hypothetical protein